MPDGMTAMIKLIATLTDDAVDVAIKGLVSDETNGPDVSLDQLREESGLLPGVDRMGTKSITQQIWGEPAVTIIGLDAPSVAVSSNTALPEVTARVSLRLAPSQNPHEGLELLKKHLLDHAPFGAEISFGPHE
ncbi:MAG: peptidase dimerization domain-containing protein, partial [Gammaproteobacteria bacterium]